MFRTVALTLVILVITACSTTGTVHQAPRLQPGQTYAYSFSNQGGGDNEGIARLDGVIHSRLSEAGLINAGDANPKIVVALKHYYLRSNGARIWAGFLAGRDKIVSNVRVIGADGSQIGNFDVKTSNFTAWGTTDGIMEKHAEELVSRLKSIPLHRKARRRACLQTQSHSCSGRISGGAGGL